MKYTWNLEAYFLLSLLTSVLTLVDFPHFRPHSQRQVTCDFKLWWTAKSWTGACRRWCSKLTICVVLTAYTASVASWKNATVDKIIMHSWYYDRLLCLEMNLQLQNNRVRMQNCFFFPLFSCNYATYTYLLMRWYLLYVSTFRKHGMVWYLLFDDELIYAAGLEAWSFWTDNTRVNGNVRPDCRLKPHAMPLGRKLAPWKVIGTYKKVLSDFTNNGEKNLCHHYYLCTHYYLSYSISVAPFF